MKTWTEAIGQEKQQSYFLNIIQQVEQAKKSGKTVYPPHDEIFTAFRLTEFDQVKVVILGQDPYHGPNQAHGLAFSVKPGIAPPPSLLNMYKELATDIDGFQIPQHGYLASWAQQGVLLLNTVLTVEKGQFIDRQRHLVLTAPHPSPLSAYRGFFGCRHFSKANTYLQQQQKSAVDWCLPLTV